MTESRGPILEQIAGLKLRLRTLPDELHVARETATRLSAQIKDHKILLGEHEAEVGALARAEVLEQATGRKPAEAAVAALVRDAVEKDEGGRRLRKELRDLELRRDGAELQVKHLTDRFAGLQTYADLTSAEVRLLTAGLGA